MKIGMLYSRIRKDEKMLLDAASNKGINIIKIDDRDCIFGLENEIDDYDIVLERSISHSRALYALRFFKHYDIPTVNTFDVATICGDKVQTSLLLKKHNVPTPKTYVVFTPEKALEAIEKMGYPAVLKPVVGSWARLLAKVDNRETAEAIIEHKSVLGNYLHSIFYIQEFIEKPGRDIRTFVVGDETVAAIYRTSKHWITNTARGGKSSKCKVTDEINDISLKAAEAVGNGVLAMDIMEVDNSYTIHEVNYTMEYKNSIEPTGVDIPAKILDYMVSQVKR